MAADTLQLQWSLDKSASSLLSLSRGFMEAATSDSVQVLALLTCESFGATLPVATITRLKVEKLARRSQSQTLSFLKAQVGYKAGDSADVLSRSDGGIRFLCLSALLCSSSLHLLEAAEALDKLIRRNAIKDQRLPTMMQLHDLLQVLHPKLIDCSFNADVIGWVCTFAPTREVRRNWIDQGPFNSITPALLQLVHLVEALQKWCRLGETTHIAVIQAELRYIPWTISVVKWLTGLTPTV